MLRVGVNLLWCLPGGVGGSEEYLVRQLHGLHDVAPEIDATLFVVPGLRRRPPGPRRRATSSSSARSTHGAAAGASSPRRRGCRRACGASTSSTTAAARCRRARRSPVLLTIHDVQYRTYPDYLTPLKRQYLRLAVPRVDPPRHRRRRPQRVRPRARSSTASASTPTASSSSPTASTCRRTITPDDELRARYGIGDRRYVVYPALTHPHKQHRFLLDLLAGPWSDPDLALVLLGGRGLAEDEVAAAIAALELGPRVIRPGRVPDADRDGLIAGAEALVFPSEYEGFGAPVLEAMALGTPVDLQRPRRPPGGRRRRRARAPARARRVEGRARRDRSRRDGRRRPGARRAVLDRRVGRRARGGVPAVPRRRAPPAQAVERCLTRIGRSRRCASWCIGPHVDPDTAPDRSRAQPHRRRAGRPRARAARRRRAAVVPPPRHRAGLDRPPACAGRRRRGARSAGSTRSRAATSATSPRRAAGFAGFSLLAGVGRASPPAAGSGASTPSSPCRRR